MERLSENREITLYLSLISLMLIVYHLFLVTANAWISEDCFITLRTVDNFLNGYGLRFNISERVQSYTHPLWMLFLIVPMKIFPDPFTTPILCSMFFVILTLAASTYLFKSKCSLVLFLILISISNSYISYSASGLENPLLSFLIVSLLIVIFAKETSLKKYFCLCLISSLLILTRDDYFIVILPPFLFYSVHLLVNNKLTNVRTILFSLLGFFPVVLWKLFSLIYYGFIFPNTYYAKLNLGIPKSEIYLQGLKYIGDLLLSEPITLIVIITSVLFAALIGRLNERVLVSSVVLYLIYIVYIGGDFMSGRFFTGIFLISSILIAKHCNSPQKLILGCSLLIVVFSMEILRSHEDSVRGLVSLDNDFLPEFFAKNSGITNEAAFYPENRWLTEKDFKVPHDFFYYGAICHDLSDMDWESTPIDWKGVKGIGNVLIMGNMGMFPYRCGPKIHIVDWYALTDPLMARLPSIYTPHWRSGHFRRILPDGYLEAIDSNNPDLIKDDNIRELYKGLKLIISGDLLSRERLKALIDFNIRGRNTKHLNKYSRFKKVHPISDFQNNKDFRVFELGGYSYPLIIDLTSESVTSLIEFEIETKKDQKLVILFNDKYEQIKHDIIKLKKSSKDKTYKYYLDSDLLKRGINHLVITTPNGKKSEISIRNISLKQMVS